LIIYSMPTLRPIVAPRQQ
jgi:hypothetical protein